MPGLFGVLFYIESPSTFHPHAYLDALNSDLRSVVLYRLVHRHRTDGAKDALSGEENWRLHRIAKVLLQL